MSGGFAIKSWKLNERGPERKPGATIYARKRLSRFLTFSLETHELSYWHTSNVSAMAQAYHITAKHTIGGCD